jgi:hypothetical protein
LARPIEAISAQTPIMNISIVTAPATKTPAAVVVSVWPRISTVASSPAS